MAVRIAHRLTERLVGLERTVAQLNARVNQLHYRLTEPACGVGSTRPWTGSWFTRLLNRSLLTPPRRTVRENRRRASHETVSRN
jgi:hypothetical protein